jgi:hypothetical protein
MPPKAGNMSPAKEHSCPAYNEMVMRPRPQRLHEQEIEQMRAVLAAHDASNPTEQ